jgi:hypothetical protein
MRLAALAVVGLISFAPVAFACDEEEGGPLDRAARMEKEAKDLLEHGRRAEGARLMAKAWALRAEAWQGDGAQGTPAERERLRRIAEHLGFVEGGHGPRVHDLAAWRMRVAELKARSEALERESKAAREAGREGEAKEKAAASGRLWKEAEALEREGRDRKPGARPHPDRKDGKHAEEAGDEQFRALRLHRARAQARLEEMERALSMIEAGFEPGGEGRKAELAAEAERMRAEIAKADRKAAALREDVHALRERAEELRERAARIEREAKAAKEAGRLDQAEALMRRAQVERENAEKVAGRRRAERPGRDDLAHVVEALRNEVRELRAAVEAMRRERKGAGAK